MNLISVHSISVGISDVIARELNLDNIKKAKISYGLEALLGMIIKLTVFIIVPYWFGVLKQSLIATFTFAFLRYASGGMHIKAFNKCLIVSAVIFVSIGMLSKMLVINDNLYYLLNIVSLFIIILRAPVDPPEKPIKTKQKRYVLKVISIFILLLLIYISSKTTENDVKNAIALAMYFQIATLISWDKLINKYKWINNNHKGGDINEKAYS